MHMPIVGAFSFFPLGGKRIKSPRRPSLGALLSLCLRRWGTTGAALIWAKTPCSIYSYLFRKRPSGSRKASGHLLASGQRMA